MTMGPENLNMISLVFSLIFLALTLLMTFRHDAFYKRLQSFPRDKYFGIILTAIGLIWSAFMIDQMSLGELSRFKWLLYILTPLSFFLIIRYLDELLAPRALGGILMLAPVLMVDAARWHASPWRYTISILAYIMVIKGAWLMLCPFKFRIWVNHIFASNGRRMLAAAAYAVVTILLFLTVINT